MKKIWIITLLLLWGCQAENMNPNQQLPGSQGSTDLSPQECEAQGGRALNIVGGASCESDEKNIGAVVGFISPNICCVPHQKNES